VKSKFFLFFNRENSKNLPDGHGEMTRNLDHCPDHLLLPDLCHQQLEGQIEKLDLKWKSKKKINQG